MCIFYDQALWDENKDLFIIIIIIIKCVKPNLRCPQKDKAETFTVHLPEVFKPNEGIEQNVNLDEISLLGQDYACLLSQRHLEKLQGT